MGDELCPSCLSSREWGVARGEEGVWIVICPEIEFKRGVLQVTPPSFEGMDCRPQLSLCGGPPLLCIGELLALVGHWSILLDQDCPDCYIRSIYDNLER
jgi:hypothetical protein